MNTQDNRVFKATFDEDMSDPDLGWLVLGYGKYDHGNHTVIESDHKHIKRGTTLTLEFSVKLC